MMFQAMVAMTAALEAAQHVHVAQETVIGDADEPLHQPGQARTITERLRDLMEPPSIKVSQSVPVIHSADSLGQLTW